MKLLLASLLVALMCGCGTLIPKKVELFQDKVKRLPVATSSEKETQRQAAFKARQISLETAVLASGEITNFSILQNVGDLLLLTDVVSESLGPPKSPSNKLPIDLAVSLRKAMAKLNERIDDFAKGNNENVGKKIEGTGLIQVPYMLWAGGFVVVLFIGYVLLKIAVGISSAMNPGVSLGVNAVQFGARGLARAFSQVIKGGQEFKKSLDTKISDPALKEQILDLFVTAHKQAQDEDAKKAVKHLIQE